MSAIGELITKTRIEQQISSRRLAQLINISSSEMSKIENGERENPSPIHLKEIAKVLGLNQIECFKIAGYLDEDAHEPEIISNNRIKTTKNASLEVSNNPQKPKIRVASLFAGIGGICLGFKQAGAEIVWANEIDEPACKTYIHNFGDKYLVKGDIKEIDAESIPDIDILNGGFPCQAFSVAGYRKGFDDERGNLFFEITRILEVKKPRAVLLENVKNLETHDKGNTYTVIEQQLKNLGYYVDKRVLNTMEYGNIPQNRERIYIVAFLSEKAFKKFKYPEKIELTKTIHDIIDINSKKPLGLYYENSKYYPELVKTMTKKDTVYQWRRVYCRENKSNVCPTLTANMGTGGHNVPLILDNFGIRKLTPEECIGFQGFPDTFSFPDTISNASKYKQAGNSVSVPVIKRIAENMIKALEE